MHSNHVNKNLVQMTPCMAMDATCLLTRPTDTSYYRPIPEMEALVADIRQRLGSTEDNRQNIAFSNLGLIVSAYTDNIGLESLDLDGLMDIFSDGERLRKVVKAKITNEFSASYIHPTLDMMVQHQWCAEFCERLDNLKHIGFEELWREKVLPLVQADISRKYQTLAGANIQALLTDISKMKGCPPIQNVKIFVSYFSYPTAFTLYDNSYLDCVQNFDTFRIVAHELMHGFANAALIQAYREYVATAPYLSREHERLMKGSGDEEEFVTAADFYLQFLHGGKTKAALLPALKNIYGGMMPTALVLFDMLCNEPAPPADYNGWLLDKFNRGVMPGSRTGEYRENRCPTPPIEQFFDRLFATFFKHIDAIKAIQFVGDANSIMARLKQGTQGISFVEKNEKSVLFGQKQIELPRAQKVYEANADNLVIAYAVFATHDDAISDVVRDKGSNITPDCEVNNEGVECPIWFVNLSSGAGVPIAVGVTFVVDNLRVSITAPCPSEVLYKTDGDDGGQVWEECLLQYSEEIFAAQKRVEDVLLGL